MSNLILVLPFSSYSPEIFILSAPSVYKGTKNLIILSAQDFRNRADVGVILWHPWSVIGWLAFDG